MFSNYIYTDRYHTHSTPHRKMAFITSAIEDILSFDCLGERIDFYALQRDIKNRIKRKSILFFIGDFIGSTPYLHSLSKKYEIIAIIVRDRLEDDPKNIRLYPCY